MSRGSLIDSLGYLRRLARLDDAAADNDAALLQRFVAEQDQAAFETLIVRQGPLVWDVCRHLLTDVQPRRMPFRRRCWCWPSVPGRFESRRRLRAGCTSVTPQERILSGMPLHLLEGFRTPQSNAMIEEFAAGPPNVWLTREAQSALMRRKLFKQPSRPKRGAFRFHPLFHHRLMSQEGS